MSKSLQQQKKIKVDGEEYTVQTYQPTFGFTLHAKLTRLLGQPIVKLISMVKGIDISDIDSLLSGNLDVSNFDMDALGDALQSLFSNLADDQVVPLLKEILSETYTSPGALNVAEGFNTVFAGRYLHAYKLAASTVGVQYSDFLSGIIKRSKGGKPAQAIAQKEAKAAS